MNNTELDSVGDICRSRKELYDFLAYYFLNVPTKANLKKIYKQKGLLRELADDETLFPDNYQSMKLDTHVQEYYDRFFVTSSSIYVPPFEYAIRNKQQSGEAVKYGMLNNNGSFHVQDCYQAVGFNPNMLNMFKPLQAIKFPDHYAFEISFMAYLVSAEQICFTENDPSKAYRWRLLQRQFIMEHLGQWIGDFATLAKEKKRGLYSDLLEVSVALIASDTDYLVTTMSH